MAIKSGAAGGGQNWRGWLWKKIKEKRTEGNLEAGSQKNPCGESCKRGGAKAKES